MFHDQNTFIPPFLADNNDIIYKTEESWRHIGKGVHDSFAQHIFWKIWPPNFAKKHSVSWKLLRVLTKKVAKTTWRNRVSRRSRQVTDSACLKINIKSLIDHIRSCVSRDTRACNDHKWKWASQILEMSQCGSKNKVGHPRYLWLKSITVWFVRFRGSMALQPAPPDSEFGGTLYYYNYPTPLKYLYSYIKYYWYIKILPLSAVHFCCMFIFLLQIWWPDKYDGVISLYLSANCELIWCYST